MVHPAFPFVVWLTAASCSPTFVLFEEHVNALLVIVHQLALVGVKDPLPAGGQDYRGVLPTLAEIDALPHESERVLLRSMLCRASFGGMACDVEMLLCYCSLWYARFSGSGLAPPAVDRVAEAPRSSAEVPAFFASQDCQGSKSKWMNYLYNLYSEGKRERMASCMRVAPGCCGGY